MTSEYWAPANANDVARSKNNAGRLTDVDEHDVDERDIYQHDVSQQEDDRNDWHGQDQQKLHFL